METTTEVTLESLAADFAARFETATRADGSFYGRVKEGQDTDELRTLIFAAHNDGAIKPDDWRYEFIRTALENIAEDGDDASMEPSVYTANLTAWLASSVDRLAYCDEGMKEYGGSFADTFHLLQLGYLAEQDEVLTSVLDSLRQLREAAEEAA